jgi:hypothetical protein
MGFVASHRLCKLYITKKTRASVTLCSVVDEADGMRQTFAMTYCLIRSSFGSCQLGSAGTVSLPLHLRRRTTVYQTKAKGMSNSTTSNILVSLSIGMVSGFQRAIILFRNEFPRNITALPSG